MGNEEQLLEKEIETESDKVAFDAAVADLLQDSSEEDTDTETDSDLTNDPDVDDDQQEVQDDKTKDAEPEEKIEPDYKVLYEQANTQYTQTQSELAQTQAEYQSWKGRVAEMEQQANAKVEPAVDEELQEFIELFPDTAGPVQKLIDKRVTERVGEVEAKLQELYDSNIVPLTDRVRESEVQAQEAAILQAHPSIQQDIANGKFRTWVATLPSYQQVGVQQVCSSGSVPELITLFDEFNRTSNPSNDEIKSNNSKQKQSKDTIASKVIDALSVPAEATKVDINKSNKDSDDPKKMFDAFAKQIMKEET